MNYFSFTRLIGAAWYQTNKQKRKHKRSSSTQAGQPRLTMELLEDRAMPSTTALMEPFVTTLPAATVSNPTSIGIGFDPQIAIDPLNPLKMIEVHSTGAVLAANFTTDGGQSWAPFVNDPKVSPPPFQNLPDPNLDQRNAIQRYTVVQSPSVSFDRAEQVYITYTEHDANNTSGAVVIQKFDFTGNTPNILDLAPSTPVSTTLSAPATATATTLTVNANPAFSTTNGSFVASISTPLSWQLASGITAGQTTLDVTSATPTPPATPFTISIGAEDLIVTGVAGTTWTVTRGANGTTAAGHAIGATVTTPASDYEQVLVTNVTGNTWTVQRGYNNTTAAAHGTGATVTAGGATVWDLNNTGVLYRWINQDAAYNPVVAVDTNLPTYTDPVTGTTQTDTMATMVNNPTYGLVPKGVFVAWNVNNTQPAGSIVPIVSRVVIEGSADGGHSFSTLQRVSLPTSNDGSSAPQIVFTQGTADLAIGGGLMNITWDGVNDPLVDGAFKGVSQDTAQLDGGNAATPVTATQAFAGTTGGITDAIKGGSTLTYTLGNQAANQSTQAPNMDPTQTVIAVNANLVTPPPAPFTATIESEQITVTGVSTDPNTGAMLWTIVRGQGGTTAVAHFAGTAITVKTSGDDIPQKTTFTSAVNIDAANLTSISDLDVVLNLQHPHDNQLQIILIAPDGTQITLVRNGINAHGDNTGVGLPDGQDIGDRTFFANNFYTNNNAGTVFDDQADRSITDGTSSAQYIAHYRPETGSLSSLFQGKSLSLLNGTWKLQITDFRNDPTPSGSPRYPEFVRGWTLHFTGLLDRSDFTNQNAVVPDPGTPGTNVPTLTPSATNTYALTTATNPSAGVPGIGPGVSVAIDQSLGGRSPWQGRIYMAYTGGGGSDTNVFLITSDDNGATWSKPQKLNDDTPSDNFSEGNRAQFQPTVTVDPVTGTVVVTYYDSRNDAANARAANAVIVSTDGGDTWSPVSYLNVDKPVVDFLTGKTLSYGPIPGNQAQAGTFGFGDREGVVAYGGNIYPVFSTNLNSGGASIYTTQVRTAAGPRITYGDQGPLTTDFTDPNGFISYNDTFASDGTRRLNGFVVQFDRPIDINSFTAADVRVQYQDPNTGLLTNVPVASVTSQDQFGDPLDGVFSWGPRGISSDTLAETFFIRLQTPQTKVGTYSYSIAPTVKDDVQVGTSLKNPVTAGATTIQVTTSIGINPTASTPVLVALGSAATNNFELVLVTSVTGNTWTVLRGQNGTNPAAHLAGESVAYTGNQMDQHSVGGIGGVNASAETKANVVVRDNAPLTTLSFDATATDTTIFVNDDIGLNPTPANPVVIKIGSELLAVTAVDFSGTVWTVTRGVNGSTAAAHSTGAGILIPGFGPFITDQDSFSIPTPVSGVPFNAPYNLQTVPLIITGPYVTGTSVPGQPASSDNLVLNATNNAIDVTFDRDINQATFTAADVLSMVGPTGNIAGPFTVTAIYDDQRTFLPAAITASATTIQVASSIGISPTLANPVLVYIGTEVIAVTAVDGPGTTWTVIRGFNGTTAAAHVAGSAVYLPRTFRIGFPSQTLSGTYTINLSSDIADTFGNKLDTNHNAGLDLLRGFTDPANASIARPIYANAAAVTTVTTPGGISATDTTVTVASSAGFPATPFVVIIGTEQIRVTNVSGTTWTITRGINGTTAAAHSATDKVTRVFEIPTSGSVTSTVNVPDAFPIVQSTTRSFFDGLTQTLLFADVTAGSPFITVNSNFGFPTSPFSPFIIQIGTEQMQVTSVSGTTWFVTRGFNNTLASSHKKDDPVLLGKPATIEVELDITYPQVQDLSATLTSPTGQVIKLFSNAGVYNSPNHANFVGTVLDDAATSPIQTTGTPILSGPFNPQTPLSVVNGLGSQGTWTLTINNNGNTSNKGTLTHWEIRLPRVVTGSNLGEATADRAAVSFRIFTQATTNSQSSLQWTPVGPAAANSGENSGRIGGLAVDPSDPSGNTVFVAGASGGVWKTTNFLTTDPNGPTYVQMTDLGPTYSLNIGSLAVFARNNDPNQTVVFAATGEGDTFTPGVGFLRSLDGGRTWQVLDSTSNVDAAGAILPMASAARDHIFSAKTTSFKVVVDPTPLPDGNIAVYAALSGPNGGLWRSLDSGNTWFLVRAGQATDVVLAPASRDEHGNENLLYAAFQGDGVYLTHAPLSATTLTIMPGGQILTPRIDNDPNLPGGAPNPNYQKEIPSGTGATPNGSKGRIVLATPALTNDPLQDFFYQGWLYAAVVTTGGHLDGVYLTKDFGDNWTKLNLPAFRLGVSVTSAGTVYGTNNETRANFDVLGNSPNFSQGNYDISFAIDPNNPNITYLGGTRDGSPSGMIRIDSTMVDDPYVLEAFSNDEADGGLVQGSTSGPTAVRSAYGIQVPDPLTGNIAVLRDYRNLYRTPNNPFVNNSSLNFTGVTQFNNTGTDVRWMPFDDALGDSTDQHELITIRDPLTGGTRLIFGDDQGVWSGVDGGNGTFITAVGSAQLPIESRNGNLQITQFYYGASQPSTLAAQLADALFYGQAQDNGSLNSTSDVLTTGNINWVGPDGDGTGVGTDQTGSGTVYRYNWPCCNGAEGSGPFGPTDFFLIQQPGLGETSRVSGLLQAGDDPAHNQGQWPFLGGSNFGVNPYDGSAVAMSSQAGRIFLTAGANTGGFGKNWHVIGNPADLDGTYAPAIAFGAPIPGNHTASDFIYAGTSGGHIFVTFTQGGFNGGSKWKDISAGLDGSGVQQIVTNPKSGTYEAYAVTFQGVYWMKDSRDPNATWVKINDLAPKASTTTTISQVGGVSPTATTITVGAVPVNFPPPTPFIIQIGTEQMKVTAVDVTGKIWTVVRGYNNTLPTAHANGDTVTEANPLFSLNRPVFNNPNDPNPALQYLTTIAADWRFAIPDDAGVGATTTINQVGGIGAGDTTMTVASSANFPTPTPGSSFVIQIDSELIQVTIVNGNTWTLIRGFQGTTATAHANGVRVSEYLTHPVLYVGGEGGVFRSTNMGRVWTVYPNVSDDGAPQEGGYLPNVHVTDLDLALGNLNPVTGFYDQSSGYNMLIATTFGRGVFAIRTDNTAVQQFNVVPQSGPQVTSVSPTVGLNGLTFTGFIVNFKGNVDPSTFSPSDVTVTGPGGNVVVASVIDVSDQSQVGLPHNKFQIIFQTAQGVTGNYTLKIGPNVLDFSGKAMDQNNNNVNGEVPGDIYTTVYHFVQNTPPTISTIANKTVSPNTPATISFTVADAQDAANLLTISATVVPVGFTTGSVSLPPTFPSPAANGAASFTLSSVAGTHGKFLVTVKVTDTNGLSSTSAFTLSVDLAPTFSPPVTNPTVVQHGNPAQVPTTVPLNAGDPDPTDTLSYTVTLDDPLYDLKVQYGLTNPGFAFNLTGAGELYFVSTNGSNAAGAGFYILVPGGASGYGKLYAWAGSVAASTTPANLIADFNSAQYGQDVYAEPTLITNAVPPTSVAATASGAEALTTDPGTLALAALKTKYGLTNPGFAFNFRGAGEYYFVSTNGSNAANSGFYVLLPNNTLVVWHGSIGNGSLVADFANDPSYGGKDVYHTPALLNTASDVAIDPASVALFDVKSRFGLTGAPFAFNFRGAGEYYFVSSNGSNAANSGFYILVSSGGADKGKLYAWAGSIAASETPANLVADFNDPKFGGTNVYANPLLIPNAAPKSSPGLAASVNGAGTGTLLLTPQAGFEGSVKVTVTASDGTLSTPQTFTYTVTNAKPTLSVTPAGDVSVSHGAGPQTLTLNYADSQNDSSSPVYTVTVSGYDALFDVKAKFGLTNAPFAFNFRNAGEWYFQSTNGSNAANSGFYILVPGGASGHGLLYAWAGSIAASETPANLVADFNDPKFNGANVYASPTLINNAQAPASLPLVNLNRGAMYDAKLTFGLTTPAFAFNFRGAQEWYFQSSNGSNAANSGFYILVPSGTSGGGKFYAWQGSIAASIAQPPVADLTTTPAWSDPSQLTNARPTIFGDGLFDLKTNLGLTGAPFAFNLKGAGEWYFQSTNGSNAANSGFYILVPGGASGHGLLYAWAGSIAASETPANLVADFNDPKFNGANVYANPLLVTEATGQALAVTGSVSGNQLTLTGNPAFTGTVRVTVTASDGAEKVSQSFLYTVTDNLPTLAPIANQTGTAASGGTTVPLTAGDVDGDSLRYAVTISANPLFDVKTKYGLTNPAAAFNARGAGEWYFVSTNGSNAANGGYYILVSTGPSDAGKLYAWAGSLAATLAQAPVVDFNTGLYNGINVYANVTADQSYLKNQLQPSVAQVTGSVAGSSLNLSWPTSFVGIFGVTVTVGDGANEVQRSFLVTVS